MINSEPLAPAAEDLRSGRREVAQYVDELLERIDGVDPDVRAFLDEPDRRGRLEAAVAELRDRFPPGGDRPGLYGIPVGVKDIFNVDGLPTRAGSEVPPEALAGPEADVVGRLRDAGALVLGKTVTTEFAHFSPGPTRNPHDLGHTPGGSSSGSAAAVAAGMCPLALGSQTIGSVIRPAAFCGIVGFKPRYGRIPMGGVIPVAPSVDTTGLFTQDVAGMRRAAAAVCDDWDDGVDPDRPPVLGVPDESYVRQATDEGRARFEDHLDALETAGYEVRRVDALASIDAVNDRHRSLVAAEAALSLNEWYAEFGDRLHPETEELIVGGRETTIGDLADARMGREALREDIADTLAADGVDVLVSPAAPGPAPEGLDSTGNPVMNLPWTHAGVPALVVPAGRTTNGLPLGLQCTARFDDGERLLAWGEGLAAALDRD